MVVRVLYRFVVSGNTFEEDFATEKKNDDYFSLTMELQKQNHCTGRKGRGLIRP
jgi:hypothetical protein